MLLTVMVGPICHSTDYRIKISHIPRYLIKQSQYNGFSSKLSVFNGIISNSLPGKWEKPLRLRSKSVTRLSFIKGWRDLWAAKRCKHGQLLCGFENEPAEQYLKLFSFQVKRYFCEIYYKKYYFTHPKKLKKSLKWNKKFGNILRINGESYRQVFFEQSLIHQPIW